MDKQLAFLGLRGISKLRGLDKLGLGVANEYGNCLLRSR